MGEGYGPHTDLYMGRAWVEYAQIFFSRENALPDLFCVHIHLSRSQHLALFPKQSLAVGVLTVLVKGP